MRHIYFIVFCLLQLFSFSQNNVLSGKVLFLNSNKTPAIGVEVSGKVGENDSTLVYTNQEGSFQLVFPNYKEGQKISLRIGKIDNTNQKIEVVTTEKLEIYNLSNIPPQEFNIIVCKERERDFNTQKYYKYHLPGT